MADAGVIDEVRELLARGEFLLAYDRATASIAQQSDDLEAKYLSVLALARAGATERALEQFELFGLGEPPRSKSDDDLWKDITAVRARLDKDRALAASDVDSQREWAQIAAEAYEGLFDATHDPYPGVNAATLRLLSGATSEAEAMAGRVLDMMPVGGGADAAAQYWAAATTAEALLILGDEEAAADALVDAAAHNRTDYSARASTRRQLGLVCRLKGVDEAVLAPLANPTVLHYCGHRAAPMSGGSGFDGDAERMARSQADELLGDLGVGFGFGSLASGADIVVAEALLDAGAELHVVIPFATSEFVKVSVADGGPEWVARFDRCLDRANSVTMATDGEYLDDPMLFDYAARLAMGDALVRASFLGSRAHQIAIWDGEPAHSGVGTAADVARWAASGNDATVVPVRSRGPSEPAAPPDSPRQIRALLFADMGGFSQLTDAQVLVFTRDVLSTLAAVIDDFASSILSRETWGDGIYLVLSDVGAAAECALALQEAVRSIDLEGLGLLPLRGMRIGAHVGPVFEGWDPISDRRSFAGSHVTRAARIEPRTPEGEVYVTHSFAALAALESPHVWCQYVGQVPAAKDYGALPMYVLKQRRGQSAGFAP